MSTRPLTDEQLAELRHAIRKVTEHAAVHSHGHMMTIVPRGDGEQLFLGAGEPLVGGILAKTPPFAEMTGHGLNIVHITDPAYQWPDVRALILLACNGAEPLLDMLVTAREQVTTWKRAAKVDGIRVDRAKALVELYGDPLMLSTHADALMKGISEYGNYSYLPDEHHKDCPSPERGGEPGNPCLCGYEAFHALKRTMRGQLPAPMRLYLTCPKCSLQHVDRDGWETRPHRTHRCEGCSHEWRPADVPTVGVAEIPEP